jgi:hypothetical protein
MDNNTNVYPPIVQIILDDGGGEGGGGGAQRRIDWEFAGLFPLGMNAWCIHYLSIPIIHGKDTITSNSKPMIQAFWNNLTSNVPRHLHRNLIVAMQVGFVVVHTFFEGGTVGREALGLFVGRFDWLTRCFEEFCAA